MCADFRTYVAIFVWLFLACEDNEQRICTPYDPPPELDIYEFPLVPGMPAWGELNSADEMDSVTQLPDSVRNKITTAGLVETCYNYPLRLNMTVFPTFQRGVEEIMNRFNGFQELSLRGDAATALLDRYAEMDPLCFAGLEAGIELGDYSLSYALFEAVIAQELFLTKFSDGQQERLLQLALEHLSKKNRYKDVYGVFSRKTTAIIMARLMVLKSYQPFLDAIQEHRFLEEFITSIELQDRFETIDIVANYATRLNNL